MKIPAVKHFPTELHVGEETYTVKYTKDIPGCVPDDCGLTDPETHTIWIRAGMTKAMTFRTLVHECLHAIEFEYELKVKHSLVYQLERAISDFFLMNF